MTVAKTTAPALVAAPVSRYALAALPKAAKAALLSEEAAMDQVMMFLSYYDIDVARITEEQSLQQSERTLDHLRSFIQEGRVEIRRGEGETLEVVHNLKGGSSVIYYEVNADAKLAMDKYPAEARYARVYALMGALCKLGSDAIKKFHVRDLAVVDILGSLFMSA